MQYVILNKNSLYALIKDMQCYIVHCNGSALLSLHTAQSFHTVWGILSIRILWTASDVGPKQSVLFCAILVHDHNKRPWWWDVLKAAGGHTIFTVTFDIVALFDIACPNSSRDESQESKHTILQHCIAILFYILCYIMCQLYTVLTQMYYWMICYRFSCTACSTCNKPNSCCK